MVEKDKTEFKSSIYVLMYLMRVGLSYTFPQVRVTNLCENGFKIEFWIRRFCETALYSNFGIFGAFY